MIHLPTSTKVTSFTKYVDIRYHYVRDLVDKNIVKLVYCPSKEMLADILTKPIPRVSLEKAIRSLGFSVNELPKCCTPEQGMCYNDRHSSAINLRKFVRYDEASPSAVKDLSPRRGTPAVPPTI